MAFKRRRFRLPANFLLLSFSRVIVYFALFSLANIRLKHKKSRRNRSSLTTIGLNFRIFQEKREKESGFKMRSIFFHFDFGLC